MLLALAVWSTAQAGDTFLWSRGLAAVAVAPGGLLADIAAEARTPVFRRDTLGFEDTFLGAGLRIAASPAHLDTAVRASFQPIDLLPITVEAGRTTYWESPFGLVPTSTSVGLTQLGRRPLYEADLDFSGSALWASVSPTAQMRVGPVVAFSNVTVTILRIRPDDAPARWVFEPYRGLAVDYDDRIIEHTSAVLVEPLNGEDRALVRFGPALRGKASVETPDATLNLGGIVQWRPSAKPTGPTMLFLLAPYLRDPDFVGKPPYFAAVFTVERMDPFRR